MGVRDIGSRLMAKGKIKAEWHQKVSAGDLVVDDEGDKPLEMRDTSREKIAAARILSTDMVVSCANRLW